MARAAVLRSGYVRTTRRAVRRNGRTAFTFLVVTSLAASGGYGLYTYVYDSEYFRVKTIEVSGAHLLRAEDIVSASGISNEDNTLFVRSELVADRIETMPYIKSCVVTRTLPDVVSIAIEERFPVATLLVHNRPYEIDADLTVLRRLFADEPHTGPLISQVNNIGAIEPGMQLTQTPLRVAVDVWRAYSATAMAQDVTVSEIAALGSNDIRMYCDELPFEIRWGRDNIAQQAKNLEVLWQKRGPTLPCTEYLDLRFGQDLACK